MPEMIMTVAIIGLLSGLVVNSISNVNVDASRMIARQQQTVLQSAVQSWAASQTRDPLTGQIQSMEAIRADYNSRGHSKARLSLISEFLDDATFNHLDSSTTNTAKIKSDALSKIKMHLTLDTWGASSYPKVLMAADQ